MNKKKRMQIKEELQSLTPKLDIKEILRKASPQEKPSSGVWSRSMKKPIWVYSIVGTFALLMVIVVGLLGTEHAMKDNVSLDVGETTKEEPNDKNHLFGFVGIVVCYLDQISQQDYEDSYHKDLLQIHPYVYIYDAYQMVDRANRITIGASDNPLYDYKMAITTPKDYFLIYVKSKEILVQVDGREYVVHYERQKNQYTFTTSTPNMDLTLQGNESGLIVRRDADQANRSETKLAWSDGTLSVQIKDIGSTKNFKIEMLPQNENALGIEFSETTEGDHTVGVIQVLLNGNYYLYQGYIGSDSLNGPILK